MHSATIKYFKTLSLSNQNSQEGASQSQGGANVPPRPPERSPVSGITVLNNIVLIINRSRLSIAQLSSSFKRLDTHTFTYATPTLITEVLRLVTQVQLLLTTIIVN